MVVQRRIARRRAEDYNGHHAQALLNGCCHFPILAKEFFPPGTTPTTPDVAAMRPAWEIMRDRLLPIYVERFPGHRPFAWWQFDAPEPHCRVLSGYDAFEDDDCPHPLKIINGTYHTISSREWSDPTVWETEPAYLDRHDLLSDEERAALGWDFPREMLHCWPNPQPADWDADAYEFNRLCWFNVKELIDV